MGEAGPLGLCEWGALVLVGQSNAALEKRNRWLWRPSSDVASAGPVVGRGHARLETAA